MHSEFRTTKYTSFVSSDNSSYSNIHLNIRMHTVDMQSFPSETLHESSDRVKDALQILRWLLLVPEHR